LNWYDQNAKREYDQAREKVKEDFEQLQVELSKANLED